MSDENISRGVSLLKDDLEKLLFDYRMCLSPNEQNSIIDFIASELRQSFTSNNKKKLKELL